MPERTDWDDAVDEAIGVLIRENLDAFALAAKEGRDLHVVKGADDLDSELLALFSHLQEVRMHLAEIGLELSPGDVVAMAGMVAEREGYLEEEAVSRCDRIGSGKGMW